jgi:alpha-beta hydrolase superfamily lysophospholipase
VTRSGAEFVESDDGAWLYRYRWEPDDQAPRGVVHIAHGLGEHAGRYARLALELAARGYAVYSHDHRGHGRTAGGPDGLGFFAARDGWNRVVRDIRILLAVERRMHPRTPALLIGHSMGSFMAQQFIAETGHLLAGCVLSGSTGRPEPRVQLLRALAYAERLRIGPHGRSRLMHRFSLDTANQQFRPTRTDFDWLSRDTAEVDKFIADPLCGFVGTTQLWIDLLHAVNSLGSPELKSGIPKQLPIYVISGSRDSVNQNLRGLRRLLDDFAEAGLSRVEERFYSEARHEIFNELNREEVTRDLIEWLDGVTARR